MELLIPEGDIEVYLGFLDESEDHLGTMEERILGLIDNRNAEEVNTVFRGLHTIKGVASFLNLSDIQTMAHALENIIDGLRENRLELDENFVGACLTGIDALKFQLEDLRDGLQSRQPSPDRKVKVKIMDRDNAPVLSQLEALNDHDGTHAGEEQAVAEGDGADAFAFNEADLITPEMRHTFARESDELTETAEQYLLELSENPGEVENYRHAFRAIHSLKGNCGFFGYGDMERVCHHFESALESVKDGGSPENRRRIIEAGLRSIDALKTALRSIAGGESGSIPQCKELTAAFHGSQAPRLLGEILLDEKLLSEAQLQAALAIQKSDAARTDIPPNLNEPAMRAAGSSRRDVRVDLTRLDSLLDLVGELVIACGMVANHPLLRLNQNEQLDGMLHHLQGVVGDLQTVALGVRMVPIEGPFKRMTRLVHDLSTRFGKKVRLVLEGEKTEIDKNVADLLVDPLVHMIRNAMDHGLETPAERASAEKPEQGTLALTASQESGDIVIHIRDDGRGMNRERILQKAMEKGMCGEGGRDLPDEDVFQFIFHPGFSTAQEVTSTSGRGVGMDVVKTNIERLGGKISIRSQTGKGTDIALRIPLTLSIIDGMQVRVGGGQFIIPLLSVCESIAVKPGQVTTMADGREILALRGKVIPIARLNRFQGHAAGNVGGILLRLEYHGQSFCLLVDEILGQRQTVVKALPEFLGKVVGVSSCSILDNGEISLILDVGGLWQLHNQEITPMRIAV